MLGEAIYLFESREIARGDVRRVKLGHVLDDARWGDIAAERRDEHRHDLHQILAYASLFDGAEVTAVLLYPMRRRTWARLAEHDRTVARATLTGGGRLVHLAMAGVPMRLPASESGASLSRAWNAGRREAA